MATKKKTTAKKPAAKKAVAKKAPAKTSKKIHPLEDSWEVVVWVFVFGVALGVCVGYALSLNVS